MLYTSRPVLSTWVRLAHPDIASRIKRKLTENSCPAPSACIKKSIARAPTNETEAIAIRRSDILRNRLAMRKDCQKAEGSRGSSRDRQKSDIVGPRLFFRRLVANKRKPPLSQLIFHGRTSGRSGRGPIRRDNATEFVRKRDRTEAVEEDEKWWTTEIGEIGIIHGQFYSQLYPCSRLFWDISQHPSLSPSKPSHFPHVHVSQPDSHRSLTRNRLGRSTNLFAHIAARRATLETLTTNTVINLTLWIFFFQRLTVRSRYFFWIKMEW